MTKIHNVLGIVLYEKSKDITNICKGPEGSEIDVTTSNTHSFCHVKTIFGLKLGRCCDGRKGWKKYYFGGV